MALKHEFLRKVLLEQPIETGLPHEFKAAEWATTHKPLLSPLMYTTTGRHLNHFKVGSDPEFAFKRGAQQVAAATVGLRVGLAAGCDQNERLVELRPWPSVSVVEHIAGIMSALRWMWQVYPDTRIYDWRAGAFFANDGMGGHIHFGRKRPTRPSEIKGLDGLARTMKSAGLFPLGEWEKRKHGDAHNQLYGLESDFRVQLHGYEYRSLPSWLQSPVVAFTVVTLSKLVLFEPGLTTDWKATNPKTARNLLRGLAKLYKGRDDDAYLLYHILTRDGDKPFNFIFDQDFAAAWGICREQQQTIPYKPYILPSCIQPDKVEVDEMRQHLLFDRPLGFTEIKPSFIGTIPKGYTWLPNILIGNRRSGFGDLLHNLVVSSEIPIRLDYINTGRFTIAGILPGFWTSNEVLMLKRFEPKVDIRLDRNADETCIVVTKEMCQTDRIAGLRAMLYKANLFPIWTVSDVKDSSAKDWLDSHSKQSKRFDAAKKMQWRTL